MRIGILETGTPPGDLAERFGDYPAMVRDLLGPEHQYRTWRVYAGELPPAGEESDVYVLTGSSAGVRDDPPWIAALVDFVRAARGRSRLVGICFGHQLLAHAFGGEVARASGGWGVGLHRYTFGTTIIDVIASHQDQVVAVPDGAEVVGGSAFTPNAALAWRDGSAISIQSHPEFSPAFARALLAARGEDGPDAATRAAALTSLDRPADTHVVSDWIATFMGAAPPA